MDGLLSQSRVLNSSIFGLEGTLNTLAITAGDILCFRYDSTVSNNSSSNHWSFPSNYAGIMRYSGTYRITFTLTCWGESGYADAQIYKNGVAYGTLRTVAYPNAVTYTEDLYFAAGDEMEIGHKPQTHGVSSRISELYIKTAQHPLVSNSNNP